MEVHNRSSSPKLFLKSSCLNCQNWQLSMCLESRMLQKSRVYIFESHTKTTNRQSKNYTKNIIFGTRISGRYAPFILATAQGMQSHALFIFSPVPPFPFPFPLSPYPLSATHRNFARQTEGVQLYVYIL